jgi:hypothetical protein
VNPNYYAWGETSTKSDYRGYTYFDPNYNKYYIHGNTSLDLKDDAAYVNWGTPCLIPTKEQFAELFDSDNCTWTWTSMTASNGYSHNGYKVTSVKNGNSIFLPASGYRDGANLISRGSIGGYWSKTLDFSRSDCARALIFYSDSHHEHYSVRYQGHTVRPVAKP